MTYPQYNGLIRAAMAAPNEEVFLGELGFPDWLAELYGEDIARLVDDLRNIYFVATATTTELRKAAGLTQAALSDRLAIPQRTIEGWDTSERTPPEYVRLMVADCLGLVKVTRT